MAAGAAGACYVTPLNVVIVYDYNHRPLSVLVRRNTPLLGWLDETNDAASAFAKDTHDIVRRVLLRAAAERGYDGPSERIERPTSFLSDIFAAGNLSIQPIDIERSGDALKSDYTPVSLYQYSSYMAGYNHAATLHVLARMLRDYRGGPLSFHFAHWRLRHAADIPFWMKQEKSEPGRRGPDEESIERSAETDEQAQLLEAAVRRETVDVVRREVEHLSAASEPHVTRMVELVAAADMFFKSAQTVTVEEDVPLGGSDDGDANDTELSEPEEVHLVVGYGAWKAFMRCYNVDMPSKGASVPITKDQKGPFQALAPEEGNVETTE